MSIVSSPGLLRVLALVSRVCGFLSCAGGIGYAVSAWSAFDTKPAEKHVALGMVGPSGSMLLGLAMVCVVGGAVSLVCHWLVRSGSESKPRVPWWQWVVWSPALVALVWVAWDLIQPLLLGNHKRVIR